MQTEEKKSYSQHRFKFPGKEKLRSKKYITQLFKDGNHFFIFPFKVFFLHIPDYPNNQVLLSVSKKKFGKATDRNHIKRQMREAYRLNRYILQNNVPLIMAFIYIHSEKVSFNFMEKRIIFCFQRLNEQIEIAN